MLNSSGALAPPARYLFHHIPKTAGTSLNTLLGGVFGEANFLHLLLGTTSYNDPRHEDF
jgi:hypothetical protein